METNVTIEMAAIPAATMAALKRALLVAYRAPWDLTPEDAGRLAGRSNEMIADDVVAELAGGTIESKEAVGLSAFMATVLTDAARPIDGDVWHDAVWANVLGQSRQRLLAEQEQLRLIQAGRDATLEALKNEQALAAHLKALLVRCSPMIETSDAFGSRALAREIRQAVG